MVRRSEGEGEGEKGRSEGIEGGRAEGGARGVRRV